MPTQKIKVQIEAEVPVGDYCGDCVYHNEGSCFWTCFLFMRAIKKEGKKCQQCLAACANGTERALKELGE